VELRHLRYFVAVADAGTVTGAAAALRVAQPAVSQRLRALERELGVTLLHRSPTGVRTTTAGAALLVCARDLLARADATERLMRQFRPERESAVRLGVPLGVPAEVLDAIVSSFRNRYPNLSLQLVDMPTDQQVVSLRQDLLDVGLVREPVPEDLDVLPVLSEPLGIAMRHDDPLANRGPVPLSSLHDRSIIWWPRDSAPGLHDEMLHACQAAGFVPRVIQEASDVVGALGRVAAGDGLHWLPEPAFHRNSHGRPGLVWRPLLGQPLVMRTSAAWLRRSSPAGARAALLAVVASCFPRSSA
jgi:DNA-binding transcriptional LysR family regulator